MAIVRKNPAETPAPTPVETAPVAPAETAPGILTEEDIANTGKKRGRPLGSKSIRGIVLSWKDPGRYRALTQTVWENPGANLGQITSILRERPEFEGVGTMLTEAKVQSVLNKLRKEGVQGLKLTTRRNKVINAALVAELNALAPKAETAAVETTAAAN